MSADQTGDMPAGASPDPQRPDARPGKDNGWLEAAIAWSVCASIHEKYAKGKDALYSTRHADFLQHEAHAREQVHQAAAVGNAGESAAAMRRARASTQGPAKADKYAVLSGLPALREWLLVQGFRLAVDTLRNRENECNWYAFAACSVNDTQGKPLQLVVRPFKCRAEALPPNVAVWESVEVDITGVAHGVCTKLSAYSLSPDEFQARMPALESSLVAAWQAMQPHLAASSTPTKQDATPSADAEQQ
jgi:hypothetical protein